jgi:hypothetical protein
VALINKQESLTASLKIQGDSIPVSANTVTLINRLEGIVAQAAPKPAAPVVPEPVHASVPVAAVSDTGASGNNAAIDYLEVAVTSRSGASSSPETAAGVAVAVATAEVPVEPADTLDSEPAYGESVIIAQDGENVKVNLISRLENLTARQAESAGGSCRCSAGECGFD